MFNPDTSDVIPGVMAQVLARKRIGDTWIWLCDRGYGHQRYVTWVSGHNSADSMDWGHYFSKYVKAYKDFQKRISEQCELVNSYGSYSR